MIGDGNVNLLAVPPACCCNGTHLHTT